CAAGSTTPRSPPASSIRWSASPSSSAPTRPAPRSSRPLLPCARVPLPRRAAQRLHRTYAGHRLPDKVRRMTKLDDKLPHGMPSWVDLMTDDPAAARTFYGALFGWAFDVGSPETGQYTMCLVAGRQAAGLGPKPPGTPMPNAWTLYLAVDDLDATCARLADAGGRV